MRILLLGSCMWNVKESGVIGIQCELESNL